MKLVNAHAHNLLVYSEAFIQARSMIVTPFSPGRAARLGEVVRPALGHNFDNVDFPVPICPVRFSELCHAPEPGEDLICSSKLTAVAAACQGRYDFIFPLAYVDPSDHRSGVWSFGRLVPGQDLA